MPNINEMHQGIFEILLRNKILFTLNNSVYVGTFMSPNHMLNLKLIHQGAFKILYGTEG